MNYARHARGNAGNGANIDKHHRQGIFLGVPPLGRGEGKIIGIIYFQVKIFSFFRKYDGTAGFAKKLLKNQYCTSAPRITSEIPQLLPKTTKCFGQMQNLWKLKSELVIGAAKVISLS